MDKHTTEANGFSVEIEKLGEPVWVDYTYNRHGTGFGWRHLKTKFTATSPEGVHFSGVDSRPGLSVSRWGMAQVYYRDLEVRLQGDELVLICNRHSKAETMNSCTGRISMSSAPEERVEIILNKSSEPGAG